MADDQAAEFRRDGQFDIGNLAHGINIHIRRAFFIPDLAQRRIGKERNDGIDVFHRQISRIGQTVCRAVDIGSVNRPVAVFFVDAFDGAVADVDADGTVVDSQSRFACAKRYGGGRLPRIDGCCSWKIRLSERRRRLQMRPVPKLRPIISVSWLSPFRLKNTPFAEQRSRFAFQRKMLRRGAFVRVWATRRYSL